MSYNYLSQSISNVYVTSKNRLIGEDSSSFTVRFNPSLDKSSRVQVISAEIPYTWTPFDNFNNKVAYTIDNNNTVYIASLNTDKYYFNMSDLATDLKEALDNAVDSSGNATDYVWSVSFTESMLSFLFGQGSGETKSFSFVPVANSAYSMLGLSNYAENAPVDSYQCTNPANLQKTNAIYISSSIVPPVVLSNFPNGSQILAKVQVSQDVGNYLCYEDKSQSFTPLRDSYINQMHLTLIDDRGVVIDLRGADWSCELSFQYDT
jgi:hypothetical protein